MPELQEREEMKGIPQRKKVTVVGLGLGGLPITMGLGEGHGAWMHCPLRNLVNCYPLSLDGIEEGRSKKRVVK